MKRSNRLVLLVGVFLAIVAFVGVILLMRRRRRRTPTARRRPPSCRPSSRPRTSRSARPSRPTRSRSRTSCRRRSRDPTPSATRPRSSARSSAQPVTTGAADHRRRPSTRRRRPILDIECPPDHALHRRPGRPGHRRRHGHQDRRLRRHGRGLHRRQVPGHHARTRRTTRSRSSRGLNSTSVKLAPPGPPGRGHAAAAAARGRRTRNAPPTPAAPGTTLTGQQEIVDPVGRRPAVRGHQVRPAGRHRSRLVLRSPDGLHRPGDRPADPGRPIPDATTGIILKTLVDTYGVLPPELVEAVLPAQQAEPVPADSAAEPAPTQARRARWTTGPAPVAVRGPQHHPSIASHTARNESQTA